MHAIGERSSMNRFEQHGGQCDEDFGSRVERRLAVVAEAFGSVERAFWRHSNVVSASRRQIFPSCIVSLREDLSQETAMKSYLPTCRVMLISAFIAQFNARVDSATFVVSSTADSGAGSLRQAILDANATLGDDTIQITMNGIINLSSS